MGFIIIFFVCLDQLNFRVLSGGPPGDLPLAGDNTETLPFDAATAEIPPVPEYVISPNHSSETKRQQFQNAAHEKREKATEPEPPKEAEQTTPVASTKPDPPSAPKIDDEAFTESDKAGLSKCFHFIVLSIDLFLWDLHCHHSASHPAAFICHPPAQRSGQRAFADPSRSSC